MGDRAGCVAKWGDYDGKSNRFVFSKRNYPKEKSNVWKVQCNTFEFHIVVLGWQTRTRLHTHAMLLICAKSVFYSELSQEPVADQKSDDAASSLCKTCKTLGKVHFSSHNHISLECAGAPVPAPYSRNWINFGKISIPSYRIPVPKEHGKQEEEPPGFPNKHHTMGRRKHYPCKSGSVLIALYP